MLVRLTCWEVAVLQSLKRHVFMRRANKPRSRSHDHLITNFSTTDYIEYRKGSYHMTKIMWNLSIETCMIICLGPRPFPLAP
ncbi:uncharacterized protein EI90DRAFT_648856 [Cantharellus anzutake]|uniref:uncharacterized protein n=1 Tax=Cantharellus anzutake TaxID=1750568 RepID=UPI00190517B3|nr:uncharacterized protein EI90DRAFT_648856 [Cantharellus anzutake]KAF8333259.1 hypothetical protein EI90DRAFT_648856 [Cantharellus anzutake]